MSGRAPFRPRGHGRLRLRCDLDLAARRPVLAVMEQVAPLRVVRAFDVGGGGALVHLHNVSGGVLGGDRLELEVELGPRARAQLTSTGATRLYRSGGAGDAVHTARARVAEGALLEYLPDPLIPFAGARYRQETTVDLSNGAGLFWWETIAPGRVARGELFGYDRLLVRVDVVAGGRPIALERVLLEPRRSRADSLARLGPYRYLSTFYVCRVGLEPARWLALEEQLAAMAHKLSRPAEAVWAVSALTAHGLVVRALSCSGRDLAAGLLAFWRAAKRELYGEEAVPPRKIS